MKTDHIVRLAAYPNYPIFLFQCDGCIEKGDYIKRIEDLKPKYVKDEL